MTDEQFKTLAELTLLLHVRIDHVSGIVSRLLASDLIAGRSEAELTKILGSDFRQLEEIAKDAEWEREQARKVLGLS